MYFQWNFCLILDGNQYSIGKVGWFSCLRAVYFLLNMTPIYGDFIGHRPKKKPICIGYISRFIKPGIEQYKNNGRERTAERNFPIFRQYMMISLCVLHPKIKNHPIWSIGSKTCKKLEKKKKQCITRAMQKTTTLGSSFLFLSKGQVDRENAYKWWGNWIK